jgi:hypothetical protein
MAKKKKKKKLHKRRNWLAVWAHFRKAGSHLDKKKEQSKKACRTNQQH